MKIKFLALAAMTLLLLCSINVFAEYTEGEYYQLGKYNDKPILWRCVSTDDENGILMVSDKILSFKAAGPGKEAYKKGDNFWEESPIRIWLNSTKSAGNIKWNNYVPDYEHLIGQGEFKINYPYSEEQGFLNEKNFSASEKSVMKTILQWQALPKNRLNLSTNGHSEPYITGYSKMVNSMGDIETVGRIQLSELAESYKGAMYRISDTVFLMNEAQLYTVYKQLGTIGADIVETPAVGSGQIDGWYHKNNQYDYWLRSPYNPTDNTYTAVYSDQLVVGEYSRFELGVRPAFYLNEDTSLIISGSGTEDDPYILDGKAQEGITVFCNGKQLEFNQAPVIENDRTLVGVRTVFESLGAQVEWNGAEKVVTAFNEDTTIKLQIDNNIMQVNDVEVELDTPARLINDNTMVPLRAVSEAFDAKVDWIEDLQRIVIDVQPEWIETDWNPDWYQQALRAGGYAE